MERLGAILAPFWRHFGAVLAPCWRCFGAIVGKEGLNLGSFLHNTLNTRTCLLFDLAPSCPKEPVWHHLLLLPFLLLQAVLRRRQGGPDAARAHHDPDQEADASAGGAGEAYVFFKRTSV